MATGKSGYFDLSTTKNNVKVRVNWSETYEITTNASVVQIDSVQVMAKSPYGYYGYTYYPTGTIKIDGSTVVSMDSVIPTHRVEILAQDKWYSISGAPYKSGSITHNADGSKSVTITIDITGYSAGGTGDSGWRASGSKTVTLTTIPRASTIGATDANVGATSIIAVNRKSTSYTHSIAFTFGSLSGYINADGAVVSSETKITATNIAFSIPTSWYNQIPNAPSAVCTLTCKTYSGSTQIGSSQTTEFVVTAAQSASAPSVSGTVKDTNSATIALTGNADKLVRYFSTALCTISATAKNGASLVSQSVNGIAIKDTAHTISAVETGTFVFEAADSRGYTGRATVQKTLIEYVVLTANAYCWRNDPTSGNAILSITGNYFNGSFGAVANVLTIKYRIGSSGDWASVAAEDISYSATGYVATVRLSGLDYQSRHIVYVSVSDQLSSLDRQPVLERGIPVVHWGANDLTVEGMLNARQGQTVTMDGPNRYSSDADTDESNLESWLDGHLAQMPGLSSRSLAFACYPAVTGNLTYATLSKYTDAQYAVLFGVSYNGHVYIKTKRAGIWNETKHMGIGE